MQECGPSSSRVYCIFIKSTNQNVRINQLLIKVMVGSLYIHQDVRSYWLF